MGTFSIFAPQIHASMALLVGEVAPQFTLYSDEKKPVSLSDFKGQPVVILFFPLAFTRTCTTELCSMRDELGWYQALNARILAISVDSPQTLAAFKQSQQYNFPLLSDFNKEMIRAYGTIYEEFGLGMRGVAKRSAFVVDKEGIIRYAEVLENAGELPNFNEIKKTLQNLA